MSSLNTAKMVEERYEHWVKDFETKLERPLTENEMAFIEWLVDQELSRKTFIKHPA